MGGIMDIKSNGELNAYIDQLEKKLTDMTAVAAALEEKGEGYKKDFEELKVKTDNVEKMLADMQELQKAKFQTKSADERKWEVAQFMLAVARKDTAKVYDLGGKMNASQDAQEWRDSGWTVNKDAPNLGTPMRGDATTGSYLIPDALAAEILRIPSDPSALMGRVRTIPMSVRKITFPTSLATPTFTWVTNETTAKTESSATLAYEDLECETAAAWVAMTEEFQEDSIVDFSQYLIELFNEAWQLEFDTQCLSASAAPFTGVLHDAGVNTVTMGAGRTGFANLDLDDLIDLRAGLTSQAKRNGAAYIMHMTIRDLISKIKDDNGNYIYAQPGAGQPGTIWGEPVIISPAMPDIGDTAADTGFVIYGNPKHILHGNRIGMEFRLFNQTSDALVYDRNFLRVRLRQAFVVGQPSGFAVLETAAA
jgi:HK97 family phage major capsid protein